MNQTPRALNRVLLALVGLLFLAAGILLLALVAVPAAADAWRRWAGGADRSLRDLFARTSLAATGTSWIWIAVCAVLVVLVICMVAWVAAQGRGRANILVEADEDDDGGAPGRVVVSGTVAEHALKAALAERTDLVGATVSTYDIGGRPALKIRVLPRQGVAPHAVAADVAELVDALESVLGRGLPVLVSIGVGARTRFTRAERVR
ncbi:MAG: hypothetical protein ACHP7K_00170 [Actinomycetales bacterium]